MEKLQIFVDYAQTLDRDEKGEAQVFLDRFFQAFGHGGYKEAGATLEKRVKVKDKATRFADLVWGERLLIEMKKGTEDLQRHYQQARDYWHDQYPKPQYVILCNFGEFWIYDFFKQAEPVDKVRLENLSKRDSAFGFMLPKPKTPIFDNNTEEVSRNAATAVTTVLHSLINRGIPRKEAQHFVLQCCFCMFAEDLGLLPANIFTEILRDCVEKDQNPYDLLGGLFRQMSKQTSTMGGRFKGVDFFNGGLFTGVDPLELEESELELMYLAAKEDWAKVQPPIFGAIFEGSMDQAERHAIGAHFTYEVDIKKVVVPTIERPWYEKIENANTYDELVTLRKELLRFKVLDPACGCGNFLYVAYRELRRIELALLQKIYERAPTQAMKSISAESAVSLKQFYGIDINVFAVELAKVTLLMAKQLADLELRNSQVGKQLGLRMDYDTSLPLDNLEKHIHCADALFCKWPKVDAIIGNPPFMDARKLTMERGTEYSRRVREAYEEVPGRADYCVYWFRRSHNELRKGNRAGLVGTNSVRQNYSRMGGLDYILGKGGTITNAVSSQVWSGEASVHVSIVNWIKGSHLGSKKLIEQIGDQHSSPWTTWNLDFINSSLSAKYDVSKAKELLSNKEPKLFWEGQQTGEINFVLSAEDMKRMAKEDPKLDEVVYFYSNGDDLLGGKFAKEPTFVIDYGDVDQFEAQRHPLPFEHIREYVLPVWKENAQSEYEHTGEKNGVHQNRLKTWWIMKRRRKELINAIESLSRYIGFAATSKRQIFLFLSSRIRPSNAVKAFALEDNYSFGIMQSNVHWEWATSRCSTLTRRFRYTTETVFKQFPWPQDASLRDVRAVATTAINLLDVRKQIMEKMNWSFRKLYKESELSGSNPLVEAQDALDAAVLRVYGFSDTDDILERLLMLNYECAEIEESGESVIGPGLPPCVKNSAEFVTTHRIEPPEKWAEILLK